MICMRVCMRVYVCRMSIFCDKRQLERCFPLEISSKKHHLFFHSKHSQKYALMDNVPSALCHINIILFCLNSLSQGSALLIVYRAKVGIYMANLVERKIRKLFEFQEFFWKNLILLWLSISWKYRSFWINKWCQLFRHQLTCSWKLCSSNNKYNKMCNVLKSISFLR